MNDSAHRPATVDSLMEFLDRVDPQGRHRIGIELAETGIAAGVRPASSDLAEHTISRPITPAEASKRRKAALLTLAVTTLNNIVERFKPLKSEIQRRLRKVEQLKLWSAILTSVLSSTVVGSLGFGGEKTWTIVLGFLALLASILTLIATRLEGGAKISEEFGEVSAKFEVAIQLSERLTMYRRDPDLFDDVDARLEEANALVSFLVEKIARWNLTLEPT